MLKVEIIEEPGNPLPFVLRLSLDGQIASAHHYATRDAALAASKLASADAIRREWAEQAKAAVPQNLPGVPLT